MNRHVIFLMYVRHFWMFLFCIFFLSSSSLLSNHSFAQVKKIPLLIEVDVSSSTNRSGGPIPLTFHVRYSGNKTGLAGNLEFQLVSQDGHLMGTYLFEGLFIPQGDQTYQYLISPPSSGVWQDAFDFYPIFTTDDGTRYTFPEQLLRLPGASRRSCVVTVATNGNIPLQNWEKKLVGRISFEEYMPAFENSGSNRRPIVTLERPIAVQELAVQPLEHCVSDLVVFPGDTFAKLSERQSQALIAWVRAGGSVGVFLDDAERLPSGRLEFLNQLVGASQDDPMIYQLMNGEFQFANASTDEPLLRTLGLGRVAVVAGSGKQLLSELDTDQFTEIFIHLWKVRREQQKPILNSPDGKWSLDPARNYTVQNNPNYVNVNDMGINQFLTRFRPTPTVGGTGLIEATLPLGMEMIPLWLMGFTLILYILAIGPGDYLLLGKFELRKYTWISFPVITVLFTAGAIVSANAKMSGNNDGGRIVIRDITSDGFIARENELKTIVPSSSGQLTIDAKRELMTPVNPHQLGLHHQYAHPSTYDERDVPPVYRGRFPAEGQVIQKVVKWSIGMNRKVRIPSEPTPETSGFDWKQTINPQDRNTFLDLASRIQSSFGDDAHAMLVQAGTNGRSANQVNLCGDLSIFQDNYHSTREYASVVNSRGMIVQSDIYAPASFMAGITYRQEAGIYSVVSQISPKCDDYLEDLPLIDSSDPNSWLLVIAVRDQNNWEIYRQVVRAGK